VLFFGAPGPIFDFASLSFQVPIIALSAAQTPVANASDRIRVKPIVFVFIAVSRSSGSWSSTAFYK
jgi:hypothetical protein